MAEIVVRYEDKVIERVVTEKKRLSIGRTSDNDIVLENRGVSRRHATIEVNPQDTVIIDNESLNGTFVNNRRVEEQILNNEDVITIGKYTLTFRADTPHDTKPSDLDGTMVLSTRRQKEMLEADEKWSDISRRAGGGAVLVGEGGTEPAEVKLGDAAVTFGKAPFVSVKVKGWFIPDIQASISRENGQYILTNVSGRGRTKLNGDAVDEATLKNGDLVQIGKSIYRFIAGVGAAA